MLFYDTAIEYDPANLAPLLGLTMMRVGTEGTAYVPPLNDGPPIRYAKGKIPFDPWWNNIVLDDKQGTMFSRRDLVITVCNKDGGVHIDKRLDEVYAKLARSDGFGYTLSSHGVDVPFATKLELASIRQIGHEVLKSLKDEFPEYF
jgi:hypothetical protein